MLDHLLNAEYEPEVLGADVSYSTPKQVSADKLLDAQANTSEWLRSIGASTDDDVLDEAQESIARDAFKAYVASPAAAKDALTKITQPEAVRRVVGMLSAYEWSFVEQAQQLRSMAVTKIVEETDHPDARIRLKALEMLGRVTEVGLFTERIEIKKSDLSDSDLDARIKEKLAQLSKMAKPPTTEPVDITDAEYVVEKEKPCSN